MNEGKFLYFLIKIEFYIGYSIWVIIYEGNL